MFIAEQVIERSITFNCSDQVEEVLKVKELTYRETEAISEKRYER